MPIALLHQKIFRRILRGRPLAQIEQHVDLFVSSYFSFHTHFPALSCLRLAQHIGHYTVILSNSPSFLVDAFARLFRVDEWHATRYLVDQDKNLSHIDTILEGDDKATYVQEMMQRLSIDKKNVTVYSDSYLDLPFLLSAGVPIGVNPDRKLNKLCKAHRWTVI
jgi:phosphoserine phosphatase